MECPGLGSETRVMATETRALSISTSLHYPVPHDPQVAFPCPDDPHDDRIPRLAQDDPSLDQQLKSIADAHHGHVAIYAHDLHSDKTASLLPDEPVQTASVIKMGILLDAAGADSRRQSHLRRAPRPHQGQPGRRLRRSRRPHSARRSHLGRRPDSHGRAQR